MLTRSMYSLWRGLMYSNEIDARQFLDDISPAVEALTERAQAQAECVQRRIENRKLQRQKTEEFRKHGETL